MDFSKVYSELIDDLKKVKFDFWKYPNEIGTDSLKECSKDDVFDKIKELHKELFHVDLDTLTDDLEKLTLTDALKKPNKSEEIHTNKFLPEQRSRSLSWPLYRIDIDKVSLLAQHREAAGTEEVEQITSLELDTPSTETVAETPDVLDDEVFDVSDNNTDEPPEELASMSQTLECVCKSTETYITPSNTKDAEDIVKTVQLLQPNDSDLTSSLSVQIGFLHYVLHLPVFDDILFRGFRYCFEFYQVTDRALNIQNIIGFPLLFTEDKDDEHKWSIGVCTKTLKPFPIKFSRDEQRKMFSSKVYCDNISFEDIFPKDPAERKRIVIAIIRYMTLSGFNPTTMMFADWQSNYVLAELVDLIKLSDEELYDILYNTQEDKRLFDINIVSPFEFNVHPSTDIYTKTNMDFKGTFPFMFATVSSNNVAMLLRIASSMVLGYPYKTNEGFLSMPAADVLQSYDTEMSYEGFKEFWKDPIFALGSNTMTQNITYKGRLLTNVRSAVFEPTPSFGPFICIELLLEYQFLIRSFGGEMTVEQILDKNGVKQKRFKVTSKDKNTAWFKYGVDTVFTKMHDSLYLIQKGIEDPVDFGVPRWK